MTLVNPDVLRELITWTPYLLSGFALNIFIAMLAMLIGTGLGWGLALMRLSSNPRRLKISLMLTELTRNVPTIVFPSDNLMPAIRDWRRGDHSAALLFIPNWTSYMLIIVIASSTASIIGVSELVSRCNTVINATGNTELLLPVYLYACACFFLFCYPLTRCMQWTRQHLANRIHRKAEQ